MCLVTCKCQWYTMREKQSGGYMAQIQGAARRDETNVSSGKRNEKGVSI